MTDSDMMDTLVRWGSASADSVAIGFVGTDAQKTQAVIRRALEALIANGLLKITRFEEWRDFFIVDPPYEDPWKAKVLPHE